MFGQDNYLGGLDGLYDFETQFSKSLQISEEEILNTKNKKHGSIKRRRRSLDSVGKRKKV